MNNPPAFPLTNNWHNELKHYNGMGLRDYFAAKAMQSIQTAKPSTDDYYIAKYAYKLADEMLKVRET